MSDRRSGVKGSDKGLATYKQLFQLNEHCGAVATILEDLLRDGMIPKMDASYFGLLLEEIRSSASQCVLERLDEREVGSAAKASKGRLRLEKRLFGK